MKNPIFNSTSRACLKLCGVLVAVGLACSTAPAQDSNHFLKFEQQDLPGGAVIQATNQSLAPLTLTLSATLENMQADRKLPLTVTLKPRSTVVLAALRPLNPAAAWHYHTHYNTRIGDFAAKHDDEHVYQLPFEAGHTYRVIQGYGGAFSHQGEETNSLDFNLAIGDKVLAARAGVVVDLEAGKAEGGNDVKFKEQANFVLILHKDNTVGRYVHLKQDGVKVKMGQKVAAGALLGLSGNTGYSSQPHLHFDVYRPLDGETSERVKTRFKTTAAEPEILEEGKSYTRR